MRNATPDHAEARTAAATAGAAAPATAPGSTGAMASTTTNRIVSSTPRPANPSHRPPAEPFQQRAAAALRDDFLRVAVPRATYRQHYGRQEALAQLGDPLKWRERARAIRARTIAQLDRYLDQAIAAVKARGGHVHRAATAGEAVEAILGIIQRAGARRVVKSKSMVTEEIQLNPHLEAADIEVVETDLGEYIIQLAGHRPSHIVAPAVHLSQQQIREIFSREAGRPLPDDAVALAAFARQQLRRKFLRAGVGISGVNFLVAESGTVVLVTNEGNGRMVTSLPRIHIAVMGMERVVPTWADLAVLLEVLARSATGQKITVYTTFVGGPRRPGEADGPEEFHLVIVDNGRSNLLGTRFQEALHCIRCGACLNACPVYRQIGGHPYGGVYSGPIGAVITPLLGGLDGWDDLPYASSLCGACHEACPVMIPLHDLLVDLREEVVNRRRPAGEAAHEDAGPRARPSGTSGWKGATAAGGEAGASGPEAGGRETGVWADSRREASSSDGLHGLRHRAEGWAFRLWRWAFTDPRRYRLAARLAAWLQAPWLVQDEPAPSAAPPGATGHRPRDGQREAAGPVPHGRAVPHDRAGKPPAMPATQEDPEEHAGAPGAGAKSDRRSPAGFPAGLPAGLPPGPSAGLMDGAVLRGGPGPLGAWTASRDFPAVASRPFHARWADLAREEEPGPAAAASPGPLQPGVPPESRPGPLPGSPPGSVPGSPPASPRGSPPRPLPGFAVMESGPTAGLPRVDHPGPDPAGWPERFGRELEAVHGTWTRVQGGTPEAVAAACAAACAAFVRSRGLRRVVAWDPAAPDLPEGAGPVLEAVLHALEEAGCQITRWRDHEPGPSPLRLREAAATADLGIVVAHFAIAASGTVAVVHGPGRGRAVSLLPEHLVILVPGAVLVPTLAEAVTGLTGRYGVADPIRAPQNVTFITGPSKSSDIELHPVVGVHGPRYVHAVIYEPSRSR
ncbi:iron-sulfur cluster-binding protein [Thermaerobacter sp. PB12/4term]|uniref:LutB/LldF family L-lactate oxidation iron-sulfur protein n=1 Tax=Thermaerobacter sp. PB12/4term TaxID=2293838 RepID=UPI000E328263|nr:LutB/LldF family L-lactate oxidation iron-sulfur protein [Thermaerobacter sp. PB12/4term]QIA27556.1 iron-sulfur cluster-binding protein [Thermaerobacter sp. PB12/4term]